MLPENYNLDLDNDYAVYAYAAILDTNRNVLLTGKSGSGKSSLLRYILKTIKKKKIVLAPTVATAMINDGMTLQRFFNLPKSPFIVGNNMELWKGLARKTKNVILELDTLFIYEISMVRADIMDAIDYILKLIRGNNFPFGGVQLVMVGDLYQLSPIMDSSIETIILENYISEYFFDSKAIKNLELVKIELQKNYRQDDERFIKILDKVRTEDTSENDLKLLNKQNNEPANFTREFNTILTTSDLHATRINKIFDKFYAQSVIYHASVIGEWKGEVPVDRNLKLKGGIKIIIIKDSTYAESYYKGMVGYIEHLYPNSIVIINESGDKFQLMPAKWKCIEYYFEEGNIKSRIIGEYIQYPIKLGYACSIYKSQGLTLDKIKLDLSTTRFGKGQLYFALSRIKKMEDLLLSREIKFSDIKTEPRVKGFLTDVNNESILKSVVDEILITDTKSLEGI